MLEDAKAFDSHGPEPEPSALSGVRQGDGGGLPPPALPPIGGIREGYLVMEGERVVFSEEVGTANYLKLVAKGEMNTDLLDALEDFIRRQKKRIESQEVMLS